MAVRRIDYQVDPARLWIVEHINYEDYETTVVVANCEAEAKRKGWFAMFRGEQQDMKHMHARPVAPMVGDYRIALEYDDDSSLEGVAQDGRVQSAEHEGDRDH